jgi:hypothetical protein
MSAGFYGGIIMPKVSLFRRIQSLGLRSNQNRLVNKPEEAQLSKNSKGGRLNQDRPANKPEEEKEPVSIHSKFWYRGGRLNQKRHVDMTEEEKAHIAKCEGIKSDHPCKNPVFRCAECGNYGCAQKVADKCSEQGFKNDKCLYCGSIGTRIPLMEEELINYKLAWQKEVELSKQKGKKPTDENTPPF